MRSLRTVLSIALLTAAPAAAQDLLTNGSFEADPFDSGWVPLGATQFGGLAPGSAKAASFPTLARIGQNLTGGSAATANWLLDFYFAVRNTTNRAFSLITDGTFEPAPFPAPWITTGNITATAGLRSGSATAAWISGPATGGVNSTAGLAVIGPADWTLEFDTLILTDTGRAFQLLVHNFGEPNRLDGSTFQLRYEAGAFATLAGAAWSPRPALGQMLPSNDANMDGDFDDAEDAKHVYRIRISGTDWTLLDANLPGPSYLDTIAPGRSRRFYRVEKQ